MSDEFPKFGEAARLYAKNAAVVDRMRELFKAETSGFFDALQEEVASQVQLGALWTGEGKTKRAWGNTKRAWWIQDDEGKEEDVPYIWFRTQDASIVSPGVLKLGVYVTGTAKPFKQQLAAMLSEVRFPPTCEKTSCSEGELFSLSITYGENDEPVGIAAKPMLMLLTAVYDAWKKLRA